MLLIDSLAENHNNWIDLGLLIVLCWTMSNSFYNVIYCKGWIISNTLAHVDTKKEKNKQCGQTHKVSQKQYISFTQPNHMGCQC